MLKCPQKQHLYNYYKKISSAVPSTLQFSGLVHKQVALVKSGDDVSKYIQVMANLKRKSEGYRLKKSKILTLEQVEKLMNEAREVPSRMVMVATIFGLFGATPLEELRNNLIVEVIELANKIIISFSVVQHRCFLLKYLNSKFTANCQPSWYKYIRKE